MNDVDDKDGLIKEAANCKLDRKSSKIPTDKQDVTSSLNEPLEDRRRPSSSPNAKAMSKYEQI